MQRTTSTLFFLLLGFGLLQMGNALQGTLLAVRGDLNGFSSLIVGLLTSAFFAGMCLGSLYCDKLITQAGHIRTFAALASMGSAAALGHLLFTTPTAWITLRFVTGICFAGLIIVVESWLNASSTPKTRGKILSLYSISSMAAAIIGQLLFASADPTTFTLFVVVSIAMSLALVPISLSKATAPLPSEDQERPSIKRLWSFSPFGAFSMLALGISLGALYGLTPVYAKDLALTQPQIGLLMAALMLGGALFQYPLGALSDILSRRGLSMTLALMATATSIGLYLYPLPFHLLAIGIALVGGLILPNTLIIIAHVNDRAPVTALVAVSSALLLLYGIGAVIGPFIGGLLMSSYGPQSLLLLVAGCNITLFFWGASRMLSSDDVDAALKTSFTPAPLSPVASDLEMIAYEDAIENTDDPVPDTTGRS